MAASAHRYPIFRALALLWLALLFIATPAQATTEFKPGVPLRYFETPHFRVIYQDPEIEEFAGEVGAIAEEVRTSVLTNLGVAGPGRYDILLIDNYDAANGSATGYPYNIMRFYLTSPAPPISGSSDISDSMGETWLRELITHEYTHAVHLGHFTGWTRVWPWLFHANPFHLIYPGWFIEGLAVSQETDLSTMGRARSSSSDMFLRTAILNDRFLPVGNWGNVTGWPRGGSRYLYGGAFLYYVQQRFGKDSLRRILDASNRQVPWLDDVRFTGLADFFQDLGFKTDRLRKARAGGLERGFLKATGVPMSELLDDWRRELTLRYGYEARLVAEAGISKTTPLTRIGGNTRSPALSPDGTRVAYVASPDSGLIGLELVSSSGGRPRHLINRGDILGNMVWSPDGQRLIYSRLYDHDQPLDRATSRSDLFAYDLKQKKELRLTRGLRLRDPSISPDGRWMVAVAGGAARTRLMKLDPDGSSPVQLFGPDRTFQLSTPAISPDGRRIAMSVFIQQDPPRRARYAIGVIDADGANFRLVPGQGGDREPAWIDADHLVFSSDRSGIYNLYTVDLRDGRTRALTNLVTGAFQPQVRAGETPRVIFRTYSTGGFDLVRLELSPEELEAVAGRGEGRPVPDLRGIPVLREALSPASSVPHTPISEAGTGARTPGSSPAPVSQAATPPGPTSAPASPPSTPPVTPEAAGIEPLPLRPPLATKRYFPLTGMRLGRVRPLIRIDEGSREDHYDTGASIGANTVLIDPTDRHFLFLEANIGLSSRLPTWSITYANESLGFPIQVYAEEYATAVGVLEIPCGSTTSTPAPDPNQPQLGCTDSFLVWQRNRRAGLEAGFPWRRGQLFASATFGGSLTSLRQFHAFDPAGITGVQQRLYQNFYLSRAVGNTWRSPAQGQFFALTTGQQRLSVAGGSETSSASIEADYLARKWVGRGVIDLELQAGYTTGDYPFLIGGEEGTWALPGIELSDAIYGPAVGLVKLSVTQDLWRPEVALGQVPWFYLERVEGTVTAGWGLGLDHDLAPQRSGSAVSASLRARMFTLRGGLDFSPKIGGGYDLRTGEYTWWVGLGGWPDLYRGLLPIELPWMGE